MYSGDSRETTFSRSIWYGKIDSDKRIVEDPVDVCPEWIKRIWTDNGSKKSWKFHFWEQ